MTPHGIPIASGVYRIVCVPTGKFYIGSAVNLLQRCYTHSSQLRRNVHDNVILQRAWNKYGCDAFTFEILEYVLPMSLTAREQYWLNKLRPYFNIARVAGSRMGMKHSLESREKMSKSRTGLKQSEETIKKRMLTYSREGQTTSHEVRTKQSLAKSAKMGTLIVISPDGIEQTIHGIKKFCREHHLHSGHLIEVAKGKVSQHKGWKARYP